jgi:high-affinity Fe2+/Pb2+ permease
MRATLPYKRNVDIHTFWIIVVISFITILYGCVEITQDLNINCQHFFMFAWRTEIKYYDSSENQEGGVNSYLIAPK